VFASYRDLTWDLYRKASSGPGKDELLLKSGDNKYPSDWSRDGRFIIYSSLSPKLDWDLWVLPLFGDAKPVPFVKTRFNELHGQFSPDGQWIAYESDESGRSDEVYVLHFPGPSRKWQISTGGGNTPRWRADGKELFYLAPDGKLMAVAVKGQADFETGMPRVLFETGSTRRWPWTEYAVTSDGQRFLMPMWEATSAPLTVVINWTAELKR
jgi:Tol biopolymer transport system component